MSRNKSVAAIAALLALTSCFTGVESTPKITSKDVKKRNAVESAEMRYASGLNVEPPADWKPGKEFFVTDSRISYALTPVEKAVNVAPGEILTLLSVAAVPSMTDIDDTDFVFRSAAGDTLHYRVDAPEVEIFQRDRLDVPFTIERSLVEEAQRLLAGNDYWITTPVWFDAAGENITGRQLVKVHIDSVTPGNTVYPLTVHFTDGRDLHSRVFMSAGTGPRSTRNFDTLFLLTDPREKNKDISPETWDYITRCAVRKDMTREECRLAVGSPSEVIYGHYIEQWNYDNGRYLIFDDDHLRSFRF